MKIPDVLDAVKLRLETIDGLTVTTDPGATVVVPMAVVSDGPIEYNSTFGRGFDSLTINVTAYVSRADSTEGVYEVREYKSGWGAKSIRAALETAVGDEFPNASLTANTADAGIVDRGSGETYLTVQVVATAEIPGKES